MGYKDLYNFSQSLEPTISRRKLYLKVCELSGIQVIKTVKTTLDEEITRGFYLSAANTDHHLVRLMGGHVIVLSRALNYCWERFVYTKELMHVFDDPKEASDTGDAFEAQLDELSGPAGPSPSPQYNAEILAFWKALAVLCPESDRKAFREQRRRGQIADYDIALKLRIPERYVPRLFESRYDRILKDILSP